MTGSGTPAFTQATSLWRTLWASPQPATLQGPDFRLLDVNAAFAALVGRPREALIGLDPIELQPADDQQLNRAERRHLQALLLQGEALPMLRRRLLDAQGHEQWCSLAVIPVGEPGGPADWLSLLQVLSEEHRARARARRAEDELARWFELSDGGMLVYDASGLILRSNAAFESMVERVPVELEGAAVELQSLLAWHDGALEPALFPGGRPIERQVLLPLSDGRRRRLWARLACLEAAPGAGPGDPTSRHRVLAVVQDRSAEDERDLAQLEMGMLMDTASIGVATFDPNRGWIAPAQSATRKADGAESPPAAGRRPAGPSNGGALLGIGRELVEASSLPEFERLQQALRSGQRTEVRYAVRHPELGLRWLLTRVEPGALSGGRNTTSIVTLDVTQQEAAARRNDQLLRELTTILDSSTAGIAYLRGPALVRCNRRFERMLGYEAGGSAGASLSEILARDGQGPPEEAAVLAPRVRPAIGVRRMSSADEQKLQQARHALAVGRTYETELSRVSQDGQRRWYSLSLRAATEGDPSETVAVLTDISRLKHQQAELEQLLRDRELMFSLSEVGIVYQRGSRIERANQAMAELSGWASADLLKLDAAELYANARECVQFEALVHQALRDGGRFSGERRLRRSDGSLAWVQVAVRPVDTQDPGAALIWSYVDVDERYRARDTLAQQAERTRAILDSVLVGIVTVAGQGIEWMNRSARRMFAGELADFVGEPISLVATPEPGHPLRRVDWDQRLRQGQSESFECRLRGRDGREFWVVGNAVRTADAHSATHLGAAAVQLTFALLDIEKRRQAEVSIAQAQASLQRVIESAPLAIALFDAGSLQVQQLNQTAARWLGSELGAEAAANFGAGSAARQSAAAPALGQALGKTLQEIRPGRQALLLQTWLAEVAASGEAVVQEWQSADAGLGVGVGVGVGATPEVTSDTTLPLRVWDCRITPLNDGGARTEQLLLVATDVSEQRAADRARLQAAIDQREVLVREVHHRIKNNLQGVAGLLQQNAARHPEMSVVLSEAVGQVQAIAQVYGLQVGVSGPMAVAELLRAIAQSVQRTFGRQIDVQDQAEVVHVLPESEAIPVALTVNELFTNAIKHGQGGPVRCSLAVQGERVQIRIASQSRLPAGFKLDAVRAGVSGLGLVRALLPRRSAALSLTQQAEEVVAMVELWPPSVQQPKATESAVLPQTVLQGVGHIANVAPALHLAGEASGRGQGVATTQSQSGP